MYLKKKEEETHPINNLTFHLKTLGKSWILVVHTCNPSTWDAKAGGS
jgi:hypothetical protein